MAITMMNWQPTTTIETLKQRAAILQNIRQFFLNKHYLEVETPSLSLATVTDPNLHSFKTTFQNKTFYLQTSPEYAMKRLLCHGSGPIFQICKAFRDDELGKQHNPEFTMIEWYRPGFDHHELMNEIDEFLQTIAHTSKANKISYKDIFLTLFDINPLDASIEQLETIARKNIDIHVEPHQQHDRDFWLYLLMSHLVEPALAKEIPTFIFDFPPSQAALARIAKNKDNELVAERFEVYLNGMELANGFHELSNADEQKNRFQHEQQLRQEHQLAFVPYDQHLIAALSHGLPDCAGVALGIDRLIMLILKKKSIDEVISFPVDRA